MQRISSLSNPGQPIIFTVVFHQLPGHIQFLIRKNCIFVSKYLRRILNSARPDRCGAHQKCPCWQLPPKTYETVVNSLVFYGNYTALIF